MVEKLTQIQQEQVGTPEKSAEELCLETLKLKRDLLSSHYALNSLRRALDKRVKQMTDEEFKSDLEVSNYKKVADEYNRRRRIFLESFDSLSEADREKITELTSLTKIEIELSSRKSAVVEPEVKPEKEISEQQVVEKPEREITLEEAERMLKYSKDTGRVLELAYWESKRAELLERQDAEANPDRTAPKGFTQRVRDSYDSRMSPLGLRKEAMEALSSDQPETGDVSLETKDSRQWTVKGWLAERGKGILSAGIWEVRQAWRFQKGTKLAADDLEALSAGINIENADEAQEKANEILRIMRENNITTVTAPEFVGIAKNVTYEKAAENNDRIEYIIKNAIDTFKERVAKYRGQATAETVLTPENIKEVENDLRMQLNKFRDGATMEDVKNFAKVMRDNMDKRWWLRYVYAPLEASLLGYLGYTYLPWSRWFGGGDLVPGGEDIALSPEETGQRYMDHNMWEESREHLKEIGVENPTNEDIQAVDSAAAQENNIHVVNPDTNQTLWPETAGGQTKDISMVKGLIKWGAAHKAALAIKAARLGVKVATGF
ncbi:MAG: hypothetical protein A2651_00260 [Candidatus Yanofskybacteria bacterium RIFCSPHIGHO2_01_FULL_42_12]|uniref:Uncharacterized protein n=1 Tax=Candidatus Yanofskybacteria bacterium RIFCSPLOWO2_01_FULL_42_49 TaxID=1802694 RepID=A0A1F8GC41_9BACT|nr:MAG: hypothetical protein A2651_00260 [Candidatus Yanofskybacteria bacterium RIFCSPHIGHO2_01_FULL_42_12]OGN22296.1 MAG: hypothetical protein A2918_00025 [Candidatus Yanofskybacteria bacterium RIFCSPLOWO2_01_FULL_42_49]